MALNKEEWRLLRQQRANEQRSAVAAFREIWWRLLDDDAVFEHGAGWMPLIGRAAERVSTYPPSWRTKITGSRQRFGHLSLRLEYDDRYIGSRSEIKRLREEIRLASLATCEVCGEQGRLRQTLPAQTCCDRHMEELGLLSGADRTVADSYDAVPDDTLAIAVADYLKETGGVLDLAEAEKRVTAAVDAMPDMSLSQRSYLIQLGVQMSVEGAKLTGWQ